MTDSPSPTRRPLVRWSAAAKAFRLAAIAAAAFSIIILIGLSSSILTRAASERATRLRIEASYRRILPTAPALRWVNPEPVDVGRWDENAKFDYSPSKLPLRHWLFVPKYLYTPRNRQLLTVPEGQEYVGSAYLVARTPLPFVVRVHYGWIFKMRERQGYARFGLSSGAMDVGVVTYLGFFGCHVRIDEHPSFGSVS